MKHNKIIFVLFSGFLIFIFGVFNVSALCDARVDDIMVYSGNKFIGEFDSLENIYIDPDFSQNPLKLELVYNNLDGNCFDADTDIKLKLFSSSVAQPAGSIATNGGNSTYQTVASFLFDYALTVPNSFVSTITATANDGVTGLDTLSFFVDNEDPKITEFKTNPTSSLLSPGTEIEIKFTVTDLESGLSEVGLDNADNVGVTFTARNLSYSYVYTENLTDSKSYILTAIDKFGNSVSESVNFTVDNEPPEITSFRKSYSYTGSQREVTFEISVEDDSFDITSEKPYVLGNFTSLGSSYENVPANCLKSDPLVYKCTWAGLDIPFNQTSTVAFDISVSDSLGNTFSKSYSEEIFVDKEAPQIKNFYLENGLGIKNVFSSKDPNSKIVLEFDDTSEVTQIILDTGKIQLINYDSELSKPDENYYVWLLKDLVYVYDDVSRDNLSFSVVVVDEFGNKNSQTLELNLDNTVPRILSMNLIETSDVKDGIVSSGENINFRIFVDDTNLGTSQDHFIFGNFSLIDYRDGMGKFKADCTLYNVTVMQCDFNGIVVENGYMVRDVAFFASDNAANTKIGTMEVEIFQVSDEVFSSFRISDMKILNPINRNRLEKTSASAWFEGSLDLVGASDIVPINYQLKGCDESGLNPLVIIDYGLYPEELVEIDLLANSDYDRLALYFDIKDHQNLNDMNTKTMKCELAVLKRDSQKLYPSEIVDFNVIFEFYDVPRGDLLKAHAQKIFDMTEDIAWIGGWFDAIYGLYDVLNSLCSIVSSGTSLISAVSEAWTLFSISMDAFSGSISKPITIQGDRVVYGAQGGISNLFSCDGANKGIGCFVKRACDWVTCRNGATISEALFGFGIDDVPGMDVLVDVQNKMAETMCSPFAGDNRIENWNFNIGSGSSPSAGSAVGSPGSGATGASGG